MDVSSGSYYRFNESWALLALFRARPCRKSSAWDPSNFAQRVFAQQGTALLSLKNEPIIFSLSTLFEKSTPLWAGHDVLRRTYLYMARLVKQRVA